MSRHCRKQASGASPVGHLLPSQPPGGRQRPGGWNHRLQQQAAGMQPLRCGGGEPLIFQSACMYRCITIMWPICLLEQWLLTSWSCSAWWCATSLDRRRKVLANAGTLQTAHARFPLLCTPSRTLHQMQWPAEARRPDMVP